MEYAYKQTRFQAKSILTIRRAKSIIREYEEQGYTLTLRQLYYQFVSRDFIPNKMSEYKKLGAIINDARLAGYIDWTAIEDRTRNLQKYSSWPSPKDILSSAARSFRLDIWDAQPVYIEVWIEKDALIGVIERVCSEYRLPHFACRGNVSASEMWGASQRFVEKINNGQNVVLLHLGDHDPSGIDMTRYNEERLRMFIREHADDAMFEIERLALNMDQVRKYKPPPNPAKETDSRFIGYAKKFGNSSWELDALEPQVINDLVETQVHILRDEEKWEEVLNRENEYIARLHKTAKGFKE